MYMKKNNKGFTLIELLVVVAIIGILAAVGTVAYTGYTEGAKKASTKSNHAAAVKYIAAEDQKCNMGEEKVMMDANGDKQLTCEDRDGDSVIVAAAKALADFKNPYLPSKQGIRPNDDDAVVTATSGDPSDKGYVNLTAVGNKITITTCFQDTTDGDDTDCTASKDRVGNVLAVGE